MELSFEAGALCLDFLNTQHDYGHPDHKDDLASPGDLVLWARAAGLLGRHGASSGAATPAAFARALQARAAIHRVVSALVAGRAPRATELADFGALAQAALGKVKFVKRGAGLELAWKEAGFPDVVLGPVVGSAIDLLRSPDLERVRACKGPRCTWLFVDRSKNQSRKWCDMSGCGNRAKVQRFRSRRGTTIGANGQPARLRPQRRVRPL